MRVAPVLQENRGVALLAHPSVVIVSQLLEQVDNQLLESCQRVFVCGVGERCSTIDWKAPKRINNVAVRVQACRHTCSCKKRVVGVRDTTEDTVHSTLNVLCVEGMTAGKLASFEKSQCMVNIREVDIFELAGFALFHRDAEAPQSVAHDVTDAFDAVEVPRLAEGHVEAANFVQTLQAHLSCLRVKVLLDALHIFEHHTSGSHLPVHAVPKASLCRVETNVRK